MMWMMVLRPLMIVIGLVSLAAAGAIVMLLPSLNPAGTTLMAFVLVIIAAEAVIGVGALVIGVYRPIRHWLAPRPLDR